MKTIINKRQRGVKNEEVIGNGPNYRQKGPKKKKESAPKKNGGFDPVLTNGFFFIDCSALGGRGPEPSTWGERKWSEHEN